MFYNIHTLYWTKFKFQPGRIDVMICLAPSITSFSSICIGTNGTFFEQACDDDTVVATVVVCLELEQDLFKSELEFGTRMIPDEVFSE